MVLHCSVERFHREFRSEADCCLTFQDSIMSQRSRDFQVNHHTALVYAPIVRNDCCITPTFWIFGFNIEILSSELSRYYTLFVVRLFKRPLAPSLYLCCLRHLYPSLLIPFERSDVCRKPRMSLLRTCFHTLVNLRFLWSLF